MAKMPAERRRQNCRKGIARGVRPAVIEPQIVVTVGDMTQVVPSVAVCVVLRVGDCT